MNDYKHYIRLDVDGNIIHAFSDAFEQSHDGDLLVTENGGRHFSLNLWYKGVIPRWYTKEDSMFERTELTLETLWEKYQEENKSQMSELEQLRAENTELKLALTELAEIQEADKTETQLTIADLIRLIEGE